VGRKVWVGSELFSTELGETSKEAFEMMVVAVVYENLTRQEM
jgi:hypothetical protein